jgi:hypothetical protein
MNEFGKGRPTQGTLAHDAAGCQRTSRQARISGTLGSTAGLLILLLDLTLSTNIAIPLLYVFVILLVWWVPSRYVFFTTASLCSVLITLGVFGSPAFQEDHTDVFNRILALIMVWSLAVFLAKRKNTEQSLTAFLQEKTIELEHTHSDLRTRVVSTGKNPNMIWPISIAPYWSKTRN